MQTIFPILRYKDAREALRWLGANITRSISKSILGRSVHIAPLPMIVHKSWK